MTLAAAILFFGIFSLTSVDRGLFAQSTTQPDSGASAPVPQQQAPSTQAKPEATRPAAAQPTKQTPANKPKENTAKKTGQKKKVVPATTCDPGPTNGGSPGSGASPESQPAGTAQTQASLPSEAQKNCPPAKTVVRQGGITEQGIQLAGGSPGGDTTQKRQSTDQMLKDTEENLKKAAGSQLSSDQQSSVSQIRQFVTQSKSALASADYERAHTLAWKAKVLSDDLINPKK
jgi:hypothetical protein